MIVQDESLTKQGGVQDSGVPNPDAPVLREDTPLRESRLGQAAVIRAEREGLPVLESYSTLVPEVASRSGSDVRREEATKLADETQKDARELFYNQAVGLGLPQDVTLQAINEVEAESQDMRSRESFPIRQYVNSIADPSLSKEEKDSLAVDLYLTDKLNELSQDVSGWEIAKDVLLSVLIAPKDLFDAYQATGEVSPWQQEQTYRKLGNWFQNLPDDEKLAAFEPLVDYVTEAMPRSRAIEFVRGLIDPAAIEGTAFDLSVFGSIDAALLGVGTIATAYKLRKLFNPIKAGARAGDYERASETNLAIMDQPQAAEAMDIDPIQANSNALPFLGEEIDDAVASELSPAVHERIFAFRDRLKEGFTNLAESKSFAREGFLDAQDTEKASQRLYDEWNAYVESTYKAKDKVVKLNNTKQTSSGMEFEFEVTNPDGTIVKDKYVGQFSFDDIGFWQSTPQQSVFWSEKKQSYKTDFISTVNAAIRLDNTAAAVGSQLRDVVKDASKAIKGLKGKPRKQRVNEVDSILLTGDDMGKEFTPQELKAGVNGIKLDEDQIEYYYNMRGVMNGLGILRNLDSRRSMVARNVKQLVVNDNSQYFGEVVEEVTSARNRLKDVRTVWKFGEVGKPVNVVDLDLAKEYEEGYRLMRLEDNTILGGQRYQHVLAKTDQVTELPSVVLDLKKGYIPRVNPKATWFVQAFTPSSLDGVREGQFIRKAVRSFDNEQEANKFASEIYARAAEEGYQPDTIFRVVADKELEAFRAGDSGMTQVGGLVYSPRARKPVPHGDGTDAGVPRTSALEAIELYLENTKNYMSRNEWRMGLRQKWENTARFKLGQRVPFEAGETIEDTQLKALWDKINTFSGFMDKSERTWENTVKGVYEWSIEKYGRNRISDFILTQRQKDPLARLRAATFHTLLGFFNPVQLWVQAQGAAVAMSVNMTSPGRLAKAFRQQSHLAMTQHVNFDDSSKITKGMMKMAGYDSVEEMKQMHDLWKRSGLYDSTLSSADVEAAARGFPTTRNAVKRFFDTGLMFFRAGELFNRRLAFLTAVDELGGAAKVSASDKLFKEALDRTNNLILNLGKANRAQWQKGALSIPTQFMQIQTKTLESLMGMNGAFTGWERARLMFGQLALYGSAGVFGGAWAMRQAGSMMGMDQIDVNNMDEGFLRAMTGGFTDWFAYQMGANIIASDRGALLNGMDQTVLSLFTEEMTAFEWLFGPSSVGPQRFWQKWRQLSVMFPTPQDINGNVSFEAQDVTDSLGFLVKGMGVLAASPFATSSQVSKYMLMRDLGILRDKNGNLVAAPIGGFDWQTEWAALIGFKPELLQRKFDLSEINEETRKYVELRSNMLLMNWDTFLQEYERARVEERDINEDTLRNFRKRQNVLLNSISDPGVRGRVLESYQNRLIQRRAGNSQLDRQMQKFYENMLLDLAGAFTSTDTRLIQTRTND